ncbi:MAG: hypothetical protein Q7T86_14180 [Hyphomicrobiaceae bacterium]|nr:hypothetical protein [Hyphomicrobiaceae bacterium]
MRVLLAFVVLMGGIAAVAGNMAEPRRYQTDMSPLAQGDGRVASFSQGVVGQARAAVVTDFETSVQTAAADVRQQTAEVPAFVTTQSIAPAAEASPLDAATRAALARDIQSELARLGCYAGPLDGAWSPASQRAAGLFVTEANARIPVSEPDFALFSLAKTATENEACGPAITVAQASVVPPPAAMGLGGPSDASKAPKATSYRRDRDVEQLFTNPLGR